MQQIIITVIHCTVNNDYTVNIGKKLTQKNRDGEYHPYE